jgi:hypothetical protein
MLCLPYCCVVWRGVLWCAVLCCVVVCQLRVSHVEAEDLQRQLRAAESAIKDQQFKTAVLLAETERLKGNTQVRLIIFPLPNVNDTQMFLQQ